MEEFKKLIKALRSSIERWILKKNFSTKNDHKIAIILQKQIVELIQTMIFSKYIFQQVLYFYLLQHKNIFVNFLISLSKFVFTFLFLILYNFFHNRMKVFPCSLVYLIIKKEKIV
jgi:predicted membrane protein